MIIKLAKKHPDWYSKEEVKYAKIMRKKLKLEEQLEEQLKKLEE